MEGKRYEAEPRLRFNNYNTVWEQHKLKDFFEKYQNTIYVKDDEEYRQVTVSNNGTVKYRATTSGSKIGRKRQYAIDTDTHPLTLTFTRQNVFDGGIGFVPKELNGSIVTENMPLLAMHDADANFMTALFKTESYLHGVINENKPTGSAQKALHEKVWLEGNVTVPSLEEQTKIGNYFSQLDNAITLHQRKCDELKELKKYMLQNMFPKKGSNNPVIRFEGFTDAWEQRKLSELGEIMTGSTPSTSHSEYYSEDGIPWVTPTDINSNLIEDTPRKLSAEGEKVGRVVSANTVLVTCIASIGKNALLTTKGSFNQQINSLTPSDDNDAYFLLTESELWSNKMKQQASAGTMQIVNKKEFSEITTMVPSKEEQSKIGNYFSSLDHAITLHQSKCDELKELKKYMLQNMFTQILH